MPNLTQAQALQIAYTFSRFATTVENYRFAHFDALTGAQESHLRYVETNLRAVSNTLVDSGIYLTLDNVQEVLDGLSHAATQLDSDLTVLADLNKAQQVIEKLVWLSAAFATIDPAGIAHELQAALSALSLPTIQGLQIEPGKPWDLGPPPRKH
jgi:hypothetical protein